MENWCLAWRRCGHEWLRFTNQERIRGLGAAVALIATDDQVRKGCMIWGDSESYLLPANRDQHRGNADGAKKDRAGGAD